MRQLGALFDRYETRRSPAEYERTLARLGAAWDDRDPQAYRLAMLAIVGGRGTSARDVFGFALTVRQLFGLPRSNLPREGVLPIVVRGVRLWIEPARGFDVRRHRVRAECPACGQEMSAGRLHQHVCRGNA
jgi:hypothetical protein